VPGCVAATKKLLRVRTRELKREGHDELRVVMAMHRECRAGDSKQPRRYI
jgi:hypothetical protein